MHTIEQKEKQRAKKQNKHMYICVYVCSSYMHVPYLKFLLGYCPMSVCVRVCIEEGVKRR